MVQEITNFSFDETKNKKRGLIKMNEIINLSEITSKAEALISQLNTTLNDLVCATQKVSEIKIKITSQSNHKLDSSEKDLKSQIEQARREKTKASTKANECINQLKKCNSDIQQFKNNQQQNLQILQSDRSRLSKSAGEQYLPGERAAQQDIKNCEERTKKIEIAINHAQNTMLSLSTKDMSKKVQAGSKESEVGLPDDSGLNIAKDTISAMNKKRYQNAMQPQNPEPSLGKMENMEQEDSAYPILGKKYKNAKFYPYHIEINESDLPDGSGESLKKLRQSLDSMKCEYCGRTGTLEIESEIYDDRSKVHFADGTEKDEHTCYQVHVVCMAEHNTDYPSEKETHVHCFSLHSQGKIGINTQCGKTHSN